MKIVKDRIIINTEAATGGVLQEKVFLEISQNSQENTCARASFLQSWHANSQSLNSIGLKMHDQHENFWDK